MLYQFKTNLTGIHLGCEIKSKQSRTVFVRFSRNSISCVTVILTCLRKQTNVTSNKTITGKIWLQWFGRDLNSVTVNRHEIDAVVFEIKRRFGDDTVASVIVHYTDHHSCGQLTQKQIFFGDASIPGWHSKALDFHTSKRVFCSAVLQGFDMSKLYGGIGFYFANKQGHFFQRNFVICLVCFSMQAKKIVGTNQSQTYFDAVQQISILKEQIKMQFPHHIHFFAFCSQSFSFGIT